MNMRSLLPTTLLLAAFCVPLAAQQTVEQSQREAAARANAKAQAIREAEALLDKSDWKAAEAKLKAIAAADPKNAQVLFDLGYTEERNEEPDAAAEAYTDAAKAEPAFVEPRIALGLLEARRGHEESAHKSLEAAVAIPTAAAPLRARALRALARLDATAQPVQARDELLEAIRLTGQQPGDAALTGSLASSAGDAAGAEAEYRRVLAQDPANAEAAAALGGLLARQGKTAEAEAVLQPALKAHPGDPGLTASLATLYASEGKAAEAIPLVEALRETQPNPATDRLLAHLYLIGGRAADAEPLLRAQADAIPDDPALADDLGGALVAEGKFPEAQQVFAAAVVRRDRFSSSAAWGEAEGHLAFAASRNHQPQICLQALAARATVLPNSAATLFLEATAHDALHQRGQAQQSYRAFLAAAHGTLPDEEFQARHRLIALEHER